VLPTSAPSDLLAVWPADPRIASRSSPRAQERSGAETPRSATLFLVTETTPKTVYYTATTLDGFIADPADSLDWLFVQEIDERGPMNYDEFIARVGAIAMGATTYEWIRAWITAGRDKWTYSMPAVVFTHRDLPVVEGAELRFTAGDVRAVHAELLAAAGGKDVWVVGGGDLAGQFADAGLLDEIVATIAPVTLGTGRPLFPRRYALRLIDVARNGAFACARYAVLGPRTTDWAS
jgi:dihydrofolate reductase